MFGSGFGVGVAVRRAEPVPVLPAGPVPAGAVGVVERPSRLGEVLPASRRSDEQIAADLAALTGIEAALAAWRCELVAELAGRRPAAADPSLRAQVDAENDAGPPEGAVSEFFPDELALVCNTSRTAATTLLEQAQTLLQRLPATWAALADGLLDWPRARAIACELGRPADGTDPAVIAAVEAAVLPQAAGASIRRLRELIRRELLARDAEAADRRRRQARAAADVVVRPTGDGMADVVSGHELPTAAAIRDRIDQLARLQKTADGDPRPIGVLRAEVLAALVLRPWESTGTGVTAQLTIDAPLAALGERATLAGHPAPTARVDGHPITAAHLRTLLTELDLLGVRPPHSGTGIGTGTVQVAITGLGGRLLGTATLPELRRLASSGCATHGYLCSCPLLGVPPRVDRYRPTPAQRRFVTTRDRTCRHPGCTNRAGWADLDHVVPHARGGPTCCTNLCCLCRSHHRLKTFARGWVFVMDDDGTLHVTTPSGVTRTSRPPGLAPPGAPAGLLRFRETVLGRPDPDPDGPPPF